MKPPAASKLIRNLEVPAADQQNERTAAQEKCRLPQSQTCQEGVVIGYALPTSHHTALDVQKSRLKESAVNRLRQPTVQNGAKTVDQALLRNGSLHLGYF